MQKPPGSAGRHLYDKLSTSVVQRARPNSTHERHCTQKHHTADSGEGSRTAHMLLTGHRGAGTFWKSHPCSTDSSAMPHTCHTAERPTPRSSFHTNSCDTSQGSTQQNMTSRTLVPSFCPRNLAVAFSTRDLKMAASLNRKLQTNDQT